MRQAAIMGPCRGLMSYVSQICPHIWFLGSLSSSGTLGATPDTRLIIVSIPKSCELERATSWNDDAIKGKPQISKSRYM